MKKFQFSTVTMCLINCLRGAKWKPGVHVFCRMSVIRGTGMAASSCESSFSQGSSSSDYATDKQIAIYHYRQSWRQGLHPPPGVI